MKRPEPSFEVKPSILKKMISTFRHEGRKKFIFVSLPLLTLVIVVAFLLLNLFGGMVQAEDLMKGISPQSSNVADLSDEFINSTADFSLDLFKQAYDPNKNTLISPTSVYLALGMTANGANGNTLKEFEALLGRSNVGTIPIGDLNRYYYSLTQKLTNTQPGKVNIANSIWYRQDKSLSVNKDFLQVNADFYGADAYKANFDDPQTVKDINNWVKSSTANLIDKIIDQINRDTVMYLMNTVYFDAEWKEIYKKTDVRKGEFKREDGTNVQTEFMYSEEFEYLENENAIGFIKPYKNEKYSFAAILPNENVRMSDFISSLTGDAFLSLVQNKTSEGVGAALPKFEAEYEIDLVDPLKNLGLTDCFDENRADFSKNGVF